MAVKKFGAFMRLSMNDGVTRPAKRAEKSLRGVNKAALGATGGMQAFNKRMRGMRRRGMGNMLRGAMILGNSLKSILESVFLALSTHVHTGGTLPSGSTGPSDKATDFSTAYSNLSGILSTKNKVE